MRLDDGTVLRAFALMGGYLRERGVTADVAVYGGTAVMLQFGWRNATEDVDAVIHGREAVVKDAAAYAGLTLGLADEWLNNDVGGFTPLVEGEGFLEPYGRFPPGDGPGLRVLLASPGYLCAMKLAAMERADVGDKDFRDACGLAAEAGATDVETLMDLYRRHYPDGDLGPVSLARLGDVALAAAASSAVGIGKAR